MSSTVQPSYDQRSSGERSQLFEQLDTIAWAVFFIWVGIATLFAIPWGWFFLGVGFLRV